MIDDIARRTFVGDCLRQFFVGLLDTGPRTFFLLIAVQRFSADDLQKTLLSIPGAVGMTLSVLLIPALSRMPGLRGRKPLLLGVSRILSGICFALAAAFPSAESYVFWVFLGGLPSSIVYPFLTALYQENYPRQARGRLFAWAAMVNTSSMVVFHAVIGAWLGQGSDAWRQVLSLFALASLLAGWSLFRIPSRPPPAPRPASATPEAVAPEAAAWFSAMRWIWKDRIFGYMLFVWFVFGFALMMITPLKVLFLTEPRYGLAYPAATVALVVGIIPEALRLLTTPIWARIFDRHHFVGIRMAINVIQLFALVTFFWGRTLPWLCVSAALEGMVLAGGNIAWALWVTHVAPARHTAEYMSVHQFFTGLRGVIGAFLGIRLASAYGLQPVAWTAVGLVLLSIFLMAPARRSRRWVRAEASAEESRGQA